MTIIDWAAFTLPIDHTEKEPSQNEFQRRVNRATKNMADLMPLITAHCADYMTLVTAQRPYRKGYACPNVGFRVNADWGRREVLVVFGGEACAMVRKMGKQAETELLVRVEASGSRLDIATDIETDLSPETVQDNGWTRRIVSKAYIGSAQGKTLYVGSRKSEAFCRVYRYSAPHPRSHLLRVEFELKKERARAVAGIAIVHGVGRAARSVAARYEFGDPTIRQAFAGTSSKIITESHNRTLASTEQWLLTQCAPAFQRLVKEGVIDDPRAWVDRWLLGNN